MSQQHEHFKQTKNFIGAVAINAEDDLIFVGPVVLLKYFSTCRKALKEKYSYAKNYRMGPWFKGHDF